MLDSILSKMPSPLDYLQDDDSEPYDPDLLDESIEDDGLIEIAE